MLDELRAEGLTFIYNTEIVADELTVTAEPSAASGIALAREVLQAHGLDLSQVAPRTFAVVRAERATRAAAVPQDRPPAAAPSSVEEVVVQTSRYALASGIAGSHAFLDQTQVTNLPRLGDETLQAIQRLPGAAVNGFSSIGAIRGGVPNETAIVLDGLRLYEPFHLKNYLSPVSLLDSRWIAGIDVYFGGFSVDHGDRMSAIVDVQSVRFSEPRYFELGLNLFHANGLAHIASDDGATQALVSARRSNLGELSQLAENDFGKPEYSDGFLRLDHAFDEQTRLSLSALLSQDRIKAIRSSGTEQTRDESNNAYTWATLDREWSDAFSSRVIASFTSVTDRRRGEVADPGRRTGSVVDDRSFDVIGLRIDNELDWLGATHRFGAEARRLWADYEYSTDIHLEADFPFPGFPARVDERSVVLHPDGYEASGYWDVRAELNRLWTLQGGVRVDTQTYDGSGDSAQWSPRLSVLYRMAPDTRVRASWGRFYQSQGINELQVEDGVQRFYPAQHANHTILSIEHSFPAQLDLRVELYRKDYRTLSPRFENAFDPLVLLPELQFDRVRIAPQTARADGVELWLNWQPTGRWSGWLSYTWSQVRDRIDGRDVYRSWDQRHAASIGVAWTSGPWAVTVADTFHTGWPTTPLSLGSADGLPVAFGPRNTQRYDDFNSLDLRITRSFQLPRGMLDVYVEATNLASRANPCCTDFSVVEGSDGQPLLQSHTDDWLPLVPSIGVLWRYGSH